MRAALRATIRALRTLRGRLIAGTVAILLVASAGLGVATILSLRHFLVQRLDQQLSAAGGRYSAGLERTQDATADGDGDPDDAVPGQSVGTLGVRLVSGRVTDAALVGDDGRNKTVSFDAHDLAILSGLSVGGGARSADLHAVGDYRLSAAPGRDGDIQVTGLPLHPVNETIGRLFLVEASVFGAILVAGGLAAAVFVRRALRPLDRVSRAARHVSSLELTDSNTVFPRHIGPSAARNEADAFAVTFDHMLDHVHHALQERDRTEATLRQFVADASHELRTPLATIRAYAEYAAREKANSPTTAESLARIHDATERMTLLVNDLLLLARLDAGRPLEKRPVDLTHLAIDAVDDARISAPDHHWALDLPTVPVVVPGDVERLRQVLVNLLANARQHTPAGTTVKVRLRRADERAVLEVSDDGPGLPPALLDGLFERFTTGDVSRARDRAGSGLGLAIAQSIVHAHGGTLRAANRARARGAVFSVELPALPRVHGPGRIVSPGRPNPAPLGTSGE